MTSIVMTHQYKITLNNGDNNRGQATTKEQKTRKTTSPAKDPSLIPYRYAKLTQENRKNGWTGYYKDCFVFTSSQKRYRENGKIWLASSLQEAIAKAEEKGLAAVVEVKKGYECRDGNKIHKNPRVHWGLGLASYVRGDIKLNQVGYQRVGDLREYISPYDDETLTSSEATLELKQSRDESISAVSIKQNKPRKTILSAKDPSLIPYRHAKLTQENRKNGWTGYYKDCVIRGEQYRVGKKIYKGKTLQEAIEIAENINWTTIVEVSNGFEIRRGTYGNMIMKEPRSSWRTGLSCYVRGDFEYCMEHQPNHKPNQDFRVGRPIKEYESPYDFDGNEKKTSIGLEVIGNAPPYPFYSNYQEKKSETVETKNTKFSVEIIGNAPQYQYYNANL